MDSRKSLGYYQKGRSFKTGYQFWFVVLFVIKLGFTIYNGEGQNFSVFYQAVSAEREGKYNRDLKTYPFSFIDWLVA